MTNEKYVSAYDIHITPLPFPEQILFLETGGWKVKGGNNLYLCEYYNEGKLRINYFLARKVGYLDNGGFLTVFTNPKYNLTGGVSQNPNGEITEVKCGRFIYDDLQGKGEVNINTSIISYINYDEISKGLIANGLIDDSNPTEISHQVLEYVEKNYSDILESGKGNLVLAIK